MQGIRKCQREEAGVQRRELIRLDEHAQACEYQEPICLNLQPIREDKRKEGERENIAVHLWAAGSRLWRVKIARLLRFLCLLGNLLQSLPFTTQLWPA